MDLKPLHDAADALVEAGEALQSAYRSPNIDNVSTAAKEAGDNLVKARPDGEVPSATTLGIGAH